MNPAEIQAARKSLGLTRRELAEWLEMHPGDLNKSLLSPDASTWRPLPARAEKLLRAYLAGFRP